MKNTQNTSLSALASKRTAIALLLGGAMSLLAHPASVAESNPPLKVFILAGQSNMEGPAFVHTFDYIGDDPVTAPLLKEMLGPDGKPQVCDNVWISYLTGKPFGDVVPGEGFGKLTVGYGARGKPALPGPKIGPEFTFGIRMSKAIKEPILIIKRAWGNTQLAGAWRPPLAPPRTETAEAKALREARNAVLKAKAAADGKEFKPIEAPQIPSSGWCWTTMKFDEYIKKVLADPGKYHPEYDAKAGFEVAGVVWFQGYSDQGYENGIEYKGASNAGYHYMGSAEFFVEIGDAFANAMTRMIKWR